MNKRLSFEKWCSTVGLSVTTVYIGTDWSYCYTETEMAWQAYQEAYNMQQAEIDNLRNEVDRLNYSLSNPYPGYE